MRTAPNRPVRARTRNSSAADDLTGGIRPAESGRRVTAPLSTFVAMSVGCEQGDASRAGSEGRAIEMRRRCFERNTGAWARPRLARSAAGGPSSARRRRAGCRSRHAVVGVASRFRPFATSGRSSGLRQRSSGHRPRLKRRSALRNRSSADGSIAGTESWQQGGLWWPAAGFSTSKRSCRTSHMSVGPCRGARFPT